MEEGAKMLFWPNLTKIQMEALGRTLTPPLELDLRASKDHLQAAVEAHVADHPQKYALAENDEAPALGSIFHREIAPDATIAWKTGALMADSQTPGSQVSFTFATEADIPHDQPPAGQPDDGETAKAAEPVPVAKVRLPGIAEKARRQINGLLQGTFHKNGQSVRQIGESWEITGPPADAPAMQAAAVKVLHEQYGFIDAGQYVTPLV